jgi:uncharacterized protein involved in exopolysaccharide biosynthesis
MQSTFGALDLLVLAAENWKKLVYIPLAVGVLALGITFLVPKTYTATARLMVPQQTNSAAAMLLMQAGELGGLASAASGLKNPADQYVGLLASRSIADNIIRKFDLIALYEADTLDDARLELEDNVGLLAGVKDGIVSVSVDDHDPERAAQMANAYVAELKALLSRAAVTEAGQRRQFFDAQLKTVQNNLLKAETALRGSTVTAANLRAEPRAALEEVAQLRAAVTASELKIAAMRGRLADTHPDMLQLRRELQVYRDQLSRLEQGAAAKADSSASDDYMARYRNFKYQEALLETISKQLELARLDEGHEGVMVQLIDTAVAPERKSKPRRALIAVGVTVLTFLFVAAWLAARELRQTVTDPLVLRKLDRLDRALPWRTRRARS